MIGIQRTMQLVLYTEGLFEFPLLDSKPPSYSKRHGGGEATCDRAEDSVAKTPDIYPSSWVYLK